MTQYLIIGSGRAARHFSHYFEGLGLNFTIWNRHEPWPRLQECLEKATHVLVLLPDSAIAGFYQENLKNFGNVKTFVHFSGAHEFEGMVSAHPLMTFSETLYDLETYKQIPFVTTEADSLKEILPGLPNLAFRIPAEKKPYYHALCVLSGNFTTLLWQKMSSGLQSLGLPADIQIPYMNQIFQNLETDRSGALTGPLARKDLKTIQANDQALKGDPAQKIYRAFVEVYFPEALKSLEGGGQ